MGLNAKSFLPLIATIGLATTACGPDFSRPQYKDGTDEQKVAMDRLLGDTEAECFDKNGDINAARFLAEKERILGQKKNEVRAQCIKVVGEPMNAGDIIFKVQTSAGTKKTEYKGGEAYLPSSPIVQD